MLPGINIFYKELGHRIKTERIRKNISQERLGSHLELTRASVINLEKGRHRPSLFQVIQIASFFGLDYTALIPYEIPKLKKKKKDLSLELKNDKVISDEELGKSEKVVINSFLSTIQKQ